MAAAASSVVCTNKFAVLQSTDEGEQSDANAGPPLTVVKRRREKRSRQSSSPTTAVLSNPSAVDGANQRRRSLLGKSTATGGCEGILAARRIRKRSVWCIDNLQLSCTEQDVIKFVPENLSVNVLSCFATQPRRRRGESMEAAKSYGKAFRLCIHDEDRDRLLDSSIWPDSVVIAPWYFKSQQQEGDDKRPRLNGESVGATARQPVVQSVIQSSTPARRTISITAGSDTSVPDHQGISSYDNDDTIVAAPIDSSSVGNDGGD